MPASATRKFLLAALLAVDDAGKQGAGAGGYKAAHLAQDLRSRGLERRADGVDQLLRRGDLLVFVADAQTTADVEVPDVEAAVLQLRDEGGALLYGLGERGELGDLGPYVLVDPDEVDAPVLPDPLGEREGLVDGDAELVEGPARGDVVVRVGVHVRVDPQGDARPLAVPAGEAVEVLELGGGLHVEQQDALAQPRHELPLGLAHPGEDDHLRIEAGAHRPVELADGDDVGPGPEGGQRAQDRQVTVRLDRVADQVIQARESLVELPVSPSRAA